jgi:hypothetical protein
MGGYTSPLAPLRFKIAIHTPSYTIIKYRPLKILKNEVKSKRIQTMYDLGWPSGCACRDELGPKELL